MHAEGDRGEFGGTGSSPPAGDEGPGCGLTAEQRDLLRAARDWQAASMSILTGRVLDRAAGMLDRLDLEPTAVRADLADGRVLPSRLYAIAELLDHAADLASESAGLVHDNERRWRVVHRQIVQTLEGAG